MKLRAGSIRWLALLLPSAIGLLFWWRNASRHESSLGRPSTPEEFNRSAVGVTESQIAAIRALQSRLDELEAEDALLRRLISERSVARG